jgi:hypothetical protein
MLEALVQLWAGVLSATAPLKLLLIAALVSVAAVGLCVLCWGACFGCDLWRRYTRGS